MQAPGWLKRPAGASFGFGGKLATFARDSAGGRPVVKIWRLRPGPPPPPVGMGQCEKGGVEHENGVGW